MEDIFNIILLLDLLSCLAWNKYIQRLNTFSFLIHWFFSFVKIICINYTGEYHNVNALTFMRMLHDKYGNIVKFDGLKEQPSIFLFCPELCKSMYRLQGKIPMRIAMEPLHNYRKSRDNIYKGQYGLTTRSVVPLKRI